ncbi:hypothetical protein niasHS_017503 [Heterodera schachtii]|uniref:Uncharacterized protein n=1 Tax=Heterodera schachtii TaxID=97005 RepID=A0ABD2HVV5_HETSC
MSAISRELANALHNNPNAPPPGGRILLCLSESDVTKKDLKANLDDFFDGNLKIEEMGAEELIEEAEKEAKAANCQQQFDGIICSNVFTGQKVGIPSGEKGI